MKTPFLRINLSVPDTLRAEYDRHRQEQYRHRMHLQRKKRDKLKAVGA